MESFLELFSRSETYFSLVTLTLMEVVLGIDNIIFISIVASRLPAAEQVRARNIGLSLAVIFRVMLLMLLAFMARLVAPLITIAGFDLSGRDIILLLGGIFLLAKSTTEIHARIEDHDEHAAAAAGPTFWNVVSQIVLLDIVFSLDSVITAIGLVRDIPVMIIAILISLGIMVAFSRLVSDFINRHPTIKMLALSFLLMIGMLLVAEGCHLHVPRGYVYFAMAFSMFVEFLNIKARGRRKTQTADA